MKGKVALKVGKCLERAPGSHLTGEAKAGRTSKFPSLSFAPLTSNQEHSVTS